ncbi:tRNA lysidine(34) synthetase TilS [Corynebacterium lujinxingii]|uniref:tRNA(Ile)-lysidine synthase n=1 Tax=Corynebacterium lujinxingii TaxID=2763010 RepID=A0A7H0JY49_9CORY|nr:tRNA lysidine(34) synthetase TilS [Corynebacterium lujinxingii]MBC3178338.1 tRNA lysidine(34) synthetase TilS [Corynebacterium lujinxingii]NNO10785.1 tRNA lysidine(34) synthetase TilS [Corynebacterium lujinxingii]QNP89965.1 tRNA lysidine(34) synthetase TilS [Corynebacterium lujinxingii]
MEPFWPRRSPHFLACRRAVRGFDGPAVIGLSGGPDSLALVAAAAAEKKDVSVVVVDHGLQPGSAEVAERAAAAAREFRFSATVAKVTVGPGNVEAAARQARYNALLEHGGDVWVAHTADDQAETLLLGALRGNPSGMAARNGRVVRPFLTIRREDTVGACEELGLDPWHDPMNNDPAFRRVAVRTGIIPTLTELIGGDAVPALAATADRIAEDQALIERLVDLTPTTSCAELGRDAGAVRRRRLAKWLLDEGMRVQGDQLAAIEALVTDWHGQGPIPVGGGRAVVRVDGELRLR